MTLAQWLESTRLTYYLQSVTWLWSVAETLHFIGLTLLIGFAGFLDLRLMGFMKSVSITAAKKFMPWAIFGFVVELLPLHVPAHEHSSRPA